MNMLLEIAQALAFAASWYVALSSLCRLRMAGLAAKWTVLYTALFGNAMWCVWDLTYSTIALRDIAIIIMAAWYVYLTRSSWESGVPAVAQRKPAHLRGAN